MNRVIVPVDVPTDDAAITAGANHLVIARPITEAPDPAAAFAAICQEIAAVV